MNSFSILITCNYVFDHLSSMNAGVFFGFARQIHIAFLVKKALITFNFDLRILGAYKSLKSSPQCFPAKKKNKQSAKYFHCSVILSKGAVAEVFFLMWIANLCCQVFFLLFHDSPQNKPFFL